MLHLYIPLKSKEEALWLIFGFNIHILWASVKYVINMLN